MHCIEVSKSAICNHSSTTQSKLKQRAITLINHSTGTPFNFVKKNTVKTRTPHTYNTEYLNGKGKSSESGEALQRRLSTTSLLRLWVLRCCGFFFFDCIAHRPQYTLHRYKHTNIFIYIYTIFIQHATLQARTVWSSSSHIQLNTGVLRSKVLRNVTFAALRTPKETVNYFLFRAHYCVYFGYIYIHLIEGGGG